MTSMGRNGVALIEALIAMAILGSAGLAVTGVVHEAIRAQAAINRIEVTMTAADRVLAAMSLLKGDELDRAIGEQSIGEFVITIQRPVVGLYRIALAERRAPDRMLLVTVVHRSADAKP